MVIQLSGGEFNRTTRRDGKIEANISLNSRFETYLISLFCFRNFEVSYHNEFNDFRDEVAAKDYEMARLREEIRRLQQVPGNHFVIFWYFGCQRFIIIIIVANHLLPNNVGDNKIAILIIVIIQQFLASDLQL